MDILSILGLPACPPTYPLAYVSAAPPPGRKKFRPCGVLRLVRELWLVLLSHIRPCLRSLSMLS